MTATALGVHLLFRTSTGDVAYAQLATAYTIVACGLLLVVFVQPPTRAWVGGDVFSGDTRPARLVAGLSILFIIIGPMRLAQRFLHTEALRQVSDYVVIGLIAVGWGVIQRFLWRSRLLARFSGMDLDEGD
jgi:cation-transporting ATPase E